MRTCKLGAPSTLLVALLAVRAAPTGPAVAAPEVESDQAVAFQINVAHTGALAGDTLTPPLVTKWSVDLGGQVSYPLIAGGRVFVTVANTGSYGTKLYALDAATGQQAWMDDIPGTYFWSNAAYDDGRVFVVNFDGLMKAFDAQTGLLQWSVQLPGQYAFSSPPTAHQGIVYTGGAGSGGTVYAVRETDGAVLWTQSVENGDDSSPAVASRSVFVSYACPQAYAFNRISGAVWWHYSGPCAGGGGKTSVYYRERLYVRDAFFDPTNGIILDAKTGLKVGGFNANRPPAFLGKIALYSYDQTLTGNDLSSGQSLWSFAGDGTLTTPPIVVNSTIYIGGTSGRLWGLNPQGQEVWATDLGVPISGLDEQNVSAPRSALGAGEGLLVVPAGNTLFAFGN